MGQSKIVVEGKRTDGNYQELKVDNSGALIVSGSVGGGGGGTVALSGDGGTTTVTTTDVSGKISLDVNVTDVTLAHTNDTIALGDGTGLISPSVVGSTRAITVEPIIKTVISDEIDANNILIGYAAVGSSQASAVWRIKKLVTSGSITTTRWADGDANYDNIWNDRLSLTYT